MSEAEELLGLWDEDPEPEQPEKKKRTRKPREKHPRQREPEFDMTGFSCVLGSFKKKVRDKKSGKIRVDDAQIIVEKDARCWILRIGNDTTYPSSITGLFLHLARESVSLQGEATAEDILKALETTRNKIVDAVGYLEEKVEEWNREHLYQKTEL